MTVYAIDQEAQNISAKLDIPGFTPHDLRRTCSTKLGEMLVPGHLIDRITNHKPTGITDRVYNKYDYLKEKQEALNAWGARLARIAGPYRPAHARAVQGHLFAEDVRAR